MGRSTSFLASGRRTWIDRVTLAAGLVGLIEEHISYFFRDLHGVGGTARRAPCVGYIQAEAGENARMRRAGEATTPLFGHR